MYARIAGSVAPLERVPERPPGSSDRRGACFAPLPRPERLGPDVALFVAAQPLDPKVDGFFRPDPSNLTYTALTCLPAGRSSSRNG